MQYNTQKSQLVMPQYGRGIHRMVEVAMGLPTRDERQVCANTIIQAMAKMKGLTAKHVPSFLWDHLAYISNYELDIEYPCEITRLDTEAVQPRQMKYPTKQIRHRHYGYVMEEALRKLSEVPEGEAREKYVQVLANQMKQNLFIWNRDAMDDRKVIADLSRYTNGEVQLVPAKFKFDGVQSVPKQGDPVEFFTKKSKKKK